jgi:lipopolysaccharide biosynthesis glycosyltransferase
MDASEDEKFIQIEHISAATYYRLKLPELLKDVKKCIYLDSDVVVKSDLSELFRINVDDKYIAGVPAAGYYYPDSKVQVKVTELGIPDLDNYVNAGVLIMNLANMRRDNLSEEFYFLLNKNFGSQDQDILNVACYNKIRKLPFKYNVMTKYPIDDKGAYTKSEMLQRAYTRSEWNGGRKNPVIIHYADVCKPWDSVESARMKDWWEVVKLLPEDIAMGFYAGFFDRIEEMSSTGVQIKTLKASIKELKEENKESVSALKKQLQKIKSSKAYKLGMLLTWPVRALKRAFS